MAKNVTDGIAIFVAFCVVKYREILQKIQKILTSNLIISMNNDHRDLEFVCMNYV